jgi:DNA invertase Pin-like site-specific DNA recombinase
MMKLGYARVSTNEQDTAAQVSALKSAGCEKIFREKASGGRWDRPELIRLLDQLRTGDILIVSRPRPTFALAPRPIADYGTD